MKRSKRITAVLIVAMVMTIAMVVVAYAEIIYPQAWNSATGRYTQVYEMSTSPNWRYTTNISSYGLPSSDGYGVDKMFSNRDCIVQCTSNGLTQFETYYRVYVAYTNVIPVSDEICFKGTGTEILNSTGMSYMDYDMCLGIRHDYRCNSNITNKGNWSPDTY